MMHRRSLCFRVGRCAGWLAAAIGFSVSLSASIQTFSNGPLVGNWLCVSGDGNYVGGYMYTSDSYTAANAFRWSSQTGVVLIPNPYPVEEGLGVYLSYNGSAMACVVEGANVPNGRTMARWDSGEGLHYLTPGPTAWTYKLQSRVLAMGPSGICIVGESDSNYVETIYRQPKGAGPTPWVTGIDYSNKRVVGATGDGVRLYGSIRVAGVARPARWDPAGIAITPANFTAPLDAVVMGADHNGQILAGEVLNGDADQEAGVPYSDIFIWRTNSDIVTIHHHSAYRSLQISAVGPTAVFGGGWEVGPDDLETWVYDLAPAFGRPHFVALRTYLINHNYATSADLSPFSWLRVWRVSADGKVIVGMGQRTFGRAPSVIWVARAP